MQETNLRPGTAAPQALSHKKAAAELEVWVQSFLQLQVQHSRGTSAPKPLVIHEKSWKSTCSRVCFHLSPTLQGLGRLFGFKIWAVWGVCSQTYSVLWKSAVLLPSESPELPRMSHRRNQKVNSKHTHAEPCGSLAAGEAPPWGTQPVSLKLQPQHEEGIFLLT